MNRQSFFVHSCLPFSSCANKNVLRGPIRSPASDDGRGSRWKQSCQDQKIVMQVDLVSVIKVDACCPSVLQSRDSCGLFLLLVTYIACFLGRFSFSVAFFLLSSTNHPLLCRCHSHFKIQILDLLSVNVGDMLAHGADVKIIVVVVFEAIQGHQDVVVHT